MISKTLAALLLICASLTANAGTSLADVPQDKKDVIRELLDASNSVSMAKQFSGAISKSMWANFKLTRPEIKESSLNRIADDLSTTLESHMEGPGGLLDYITPVYADRYSLDELKQLVAFYKSPIGQRVVKESPIIMTNSMEAGAAWARSLNHEIQASVLSSMAKEGMLDKQFPLPPTSAAVTTAK